MQKMNKNASIKKLRNKQHPKVQDQLKEAILKGSISHRDLESIIKRFQQYEQ